MSLSFQEEIVHFVLVEIQRIERAKGKPRAIEVSDELFTALGAFNAFMFGIPLERAHEAGVVMRVRA